MLISGGNKRPIQLAEKRVEETISLKANRCVRCTLMSNAASTDRKLVVSVAGSGLYNRRMGERLVIVRFLVSRFDLAAHFM